MRQEQAVPKLAAFRGWLEELRLDVLPKSPIGIAARYALANWEALVRYCEDGELAIDNNAAERAVKPCAIGRKNWLFCGSDGGGRVCRSCVPRTSCHPTNFSSRCCPTCGSPLPEASHAPRQAPAGLGMQLLKRLRK
jgi:transposase IS66 family protein